MRTTPQQQTTTVGSSVRNARRSGVLIVDDTWLWPNAVQHLLSREPGLKVVGVVNRPDEALAQAEALLPRVVMVTCDGTDATGFVMARRIANADSSVGVVVVTPSPSEWLCTEAGIAAIRAVLVNDHTLNDLKLVRVVRDAAYGRSNFPVARDTTASRHVALTSSDLELIRCFNLGMDTRQIARHLSVAEQTVRNKTYAVGTKMKARGRLQILATARTLGVVQGM